MGGKARAVLYALRDGRRPPTMNSRVIAPLVANGYALPVRYTPSHSVAELKLTEWGEVWVDFERKAGR